MLCCCVFVYVRTRMIDWKRTRACLYKPVDVCCQFSFRKINRFGSNVVRALKSRSTNSFIEIWTKKKWILSSVCHCSPFPEIYNFHYRWNQKLRWLSRQSINLRKERIRKEIKMVNSGASERKWNENWKFIKKLEPILQAIFSLKCWIVCNIIFIYEFKSGQRGNRVYSSFSLNEKWNEWQTYVIHRFTGA